MSRWSWILTRLRRQIWFRAVLISLCGVLLATLSGVAGRFVPNVVDHDLGQDAVGTILQILASSMLAVTTFSLTAMVTAYGSATQLATPRATQLLREDPASQNALSTFLGAFVFSIVGIIGLQTGLYGAEGRVVLFAGTLLLVAIVVVTLLRWIVHITAFGRMSDVIDRVEDAACRAMADFARDRWRGALPAVPVPDGAQPVLGHDVAYIHHIDMPALAKLAERDGLIVHLAVAPGSLVHPARPLMHVEGAVSDETRDALIGTMTLGRHRTFDHDPRLGLIALSEIASRALAPATNDPGTAIEVLNALLRVFLQLAEQRDGTRTVPSVDRLRRIHMPCPDMEELVGDAFDPILREGTSEAEVSIRLTKTLKAIADAIPQARPSARRQAERLADAVARNGQDALVRDRFAVLHASLWPAEAAR
ncbi:DUF2254 domain-containing protein [Aureimonas frigidaquae]|uniref:DUF2254 domain-containing protein n=1 Tax=Aureimonas frigidaquae TaxID=424757 RepID=A0A0P0Z3Q1_9HYPH|nr:DUF2254 domain-containing protein [Aureimonas frigidaquae]BAT28710.1 hypothetical protein [Aureimonas frigidaquae]